MTATTRNVEQLRRGARIHSLVYAAYLARSPPRLYDVTWQGLLYQRVDKDGARGVVGFSKLGAVGLFFDPQAAEGGTSTKIEAHVKGMPDGLLSHARREFFSAMDEVTAAFWNDREGALTGARPWAKLVKDGAHLVEDEVEKTDKAVDKLGERYALTPEQIEAVKRVFGSKVKLLNAAARVTVPREDQTALRIVMNQPTRELLAAAGIELV